MRWIFVAGRCVFCGENKSKMLTYQRSPFWSRQSCSQSVESGEGGVFASLPFADHEQLWLTYKAMQLTAVGVIFNLLMSSLSCPVAMRAQARDSSSCSR